MLRFFFKEPHGPGTAAPLTVFFSYARRDLDAADNIVADLERTEIKVLIDRRDLPIAAEWQKELADMIRLSDTVLWLVSQHSIDSAWCEWELATLTKYQKRLVPVLISPVAPELLPDLIGNLHLVDLTDPLTYEAEIEKLVNALLVPYQWVKTQNWLANQAARPGFRLRGPELGEAEQWLREKPDFAEAPSEAILGLISRSRRRASQVKNLTMAASTLGMVLAFGAASFSYLQWRDAQMAESEALALAASQTADSGDSASAILLALKGLPDGGEWLPRPVLPAPQRSLYKALFSLREETLFEGHEEALTHAEASPDGRLVLTSSADGTARLWDRDGTHLKTLDGHSGVVNMARFSPDGSRIITVSDDRTAMLWNREGAKLATFDRHRRPVIFAQFSDDSQWVVTAGADYIARLWSAADGRHVRDFKDDGVVKGHQDIIVAADISSDNTLLATASADGTARIWPIDGKVNPTVLDGHEGERVLSIDIDPTGNRIATAGRGGKAMIWTSHGQFLLDLDGHDGDVTKIRFAPEGPRVLTASDDRTAKLWNTVTGEEIATLQGHDSRIVDVDVSRDGSRILTASVDGAIGLWRWIRDGKDDRVERMATLRGHERDIVSARFSADGDWIITGSRDHTARRWRAADDQRGADGLEHEKSIRALAFSGDGTWILTATKDGLVQIWDGRTHEPVIDEDLAPREIISAAFSHDGELIALGHEDGAVSLYRRDRLEKVGRSLIGHGQRVHAVDFSHDDARLVTASADKTVRIWDVKTQKTDLRLEGHGAPVMQAVFSPDGREIASVSEDQTIRLWDSSTGSSRPIAIHDDQVWSVAYSPDGAKIATGSKDGQVFMTSVRAADASPFPLIGHDDNVRSIAFSDNGHYLLTSSWDRTVRLWDVATREEVAMVRSEDIVIDAAFDPSGGQIAHLVRNRVRFRPVYPTVEELIDAAKHAAPRRRTRTERIQNDQLY